jgi:nucleoside-diphosphate-sugar epimerase
MRTLIVGKNSFIGRAFYHSAKNVDMVSFHEHKKVNLSEYDVVINCAIAPEFKNEKYSLNYDLDLQVGATANLAGRHYIMLSSRKVYGSSDDLKIYTEESELNPTDYYGENKLISESRLNYNEGSYTILRAANVYGFEYGRNSFMGFCMNQLKHEDQIKYTIAAQTKRDFISIKSVCKALNEIVKLKPQGIYNLSSGHGTEIGDVARSLIEGYGSGEFFADGKIEDQFILDNTKLLNALNIELPVFQRKYIKKLGEKL